jgi:hypothetical protein
MADQGASQSRGSSAPFASTSTFTGHDGRAALVNGALARAGVQDGLTPEPVTYFKFLGWDGSTPVRWISRSYVTARDGLTNITVEDEWEIAEVL